MKIKLYTCMVVASGLSWTQVLRAEELANKSEAGKHFRFYHGVLPGATEPVDRWSLLGMPKIYYDAANGADQSGWFIEV